MIPTSRPARLSLRMRCSRGMQGYMLIELLIVASIVCTVLAVVLRVCATAQNTVRTHGDATDLQQRLRVGVEAIRRDLTAAGAGLSRGSSAGPLVDAFAPIMPARSGLLSADAEMSYYTTTASPSSSCLRMRCKQDCPGGWRRHRARCRSTPAPRDVHRTEPAASERAIGS